MSENRRAGFFWVTLCLSVRSFVCLSVRLSLFDK